MAAHEPALFRQAARFLLAEDFVLHRLTGRFVTDGSRGVHDAAAGHPGRRLVGADAGRASASAGSACRRSSRRGRWSAILTAAAAAELGIPAGVPIVAGGMDQGAGAVGVGNAVTGVVSESTGGALTVQASVDHHGGDPAGKTPVYLHSAPGRYLYCPVCPTGGMALTWFRDRLGEPELASAAASGRDAYDLLTELAATAPAGCDGLTMLPHLAGAFSPEYVPEARGVFAGLTLSHGRAHMVRAVLESVAFMLRRNLELLATAGAPAAEIRSHGGGARSALWNQVKADACGVPVVTLEGEDAAVRGDAMLAGVAIGIYPDLAAAGAAMIHPQARYEPDPANRAVYDEAYDRYVRLFDALRPLFGRPGHPG